MRSKKKAGAFLIIIGLLFVAAALFLTGYNLWDDYRAGQSAYRILTALQEQIPDNSEEKNAEPDRTQQPDYIVNPDMEMPELEIDGNYYIGILDIPSLGRSLPVMSRWSYSNLRLAPCRYSGSAYTGNFTIAGHNYTTAHFSRIRNLTAGVPVIFTDVKGRRFVYEVQAVEILEATAVEDMLSDEWDLTLFTCISGVRARVAVRCLKIDE